jgi:Uma2 family endonuclease
MSRPARRTLGLDEFRAIPEARRFHELIAGEIIPKAAPSGEHGAAQAGIVGAVQPSFQRRTGGDGGPGGWWIATEVEVALETGDVVRPDIVGWRRERSADRPAGTPVKLRPDWICEVVSPSNATDDTIGKLRLYHQAAVPFYWIADPRDATLTVLRWSADGYVTRPRAARNEVVRAEPFEAIALAVGRLFGDDPVE